MAPRPGTNPAEWPPPPECLLGPLGLRRPGGECPGPGDACPRRPIHSRRPAAADPGRGAPRCSTILWAPSCWAATPCSSLQAGRRAESGPLRQRQPPRPALLGQGRPRGPAIALILTRNRIARECCSPAAWPARRRPAWIDQPDRDCSRARRCLVEQCWPPTAAPRLHRTSNRFGLLATWAKCLAAGELGPFELMGGRLRFPARCPGALADGLLQQPGAFQPAGAWDGLEWAGWCGSDRQHKQPELLQRAAD